MTDKTYSAADFASVDFARHPDGRVAARMVPKDDARHQWLVADADAPDLGGPDAAGYLEQYTDSGMARSGWSPVRECPAPEAQALPTGTDLNDVAAHGVHHAEQHVEPPTSRTVYLPATPLLHEEVERLRAHAEKAERERDAAVKAGKAEALREAASGLSWFGAQGNTLDHLTAWEVVGVCMKSLRDDADRIEKETP